MLTESFSSNLLSVLHMADMVETIFLATECLALAGVIRALYRNTLCGFASANLRGFLATDLSRVESREHTEMKDIAMRDS